MRVVPRKDVLSQAVLLSKEGGGEPEENKVDNQTGSEDCGEQNLQGVGSLQAVLLEGAGDSDEHDAGCSPGRRGRVSRMEAVSELISLRERVTVKDRVEAVPKLSSWQERVTVRNVMQSRVSWVEAVRGSQVSGGAPYSPCWGQWTRGTE